MTKTILQRSLPGPLMTALYRVRRTDYFSSALFVVARVVPNQASGNR